MALERLDVDARLHRAMNMREWSVPRRSQSVEVFFTHLHRNSPHFYRHEPDWFEMSRGCVSLSSCPGAGPIATVMVDGVQAGLVWIHETIPHAETGPIGRAIATWRQAGWHCKIRSERGGTYRVPAGPITFDLTASAWNKWLHAAPAPLW